MACVSTVLIDQSFTSTATVINNDFNSLLHFWKFPNTVASLISTRAEWLAIGADVPRELSDASTTERRLYKCTSGGRVFASVSPRAPGPDWRPLICTEDSHTLVWADSDCRAFLFAFDPEQAVIDLLSEKYREADSRDGLLQRIHKLYYRIRPLIPRAVQMRLKHAYTGVQSALVFPSWPIEPGADWLRNLFAWCLVRASGSETLPHIATWPEGSSFCVVLTHDVETEIGVRNIPALADIERRVGVRSSWNVVPERYSFDRRLLTDLARDGFEIGVHGLTHDGRLFESRRTFSRRVVRINKYGRDWDAAGFRSPACHRKYDWMDELGFDYDSSYPDTDPYQPMPGGCCTVFPWFLGNKVELPITIPQDHVVFDILGDADATLWRQKADYIEQAGGMVLVIVHPDYMLSESRLKQYEDFLAYLRSRTEAWFALPRHVAHWWRTRAAATLVTDGCNLSIRCEAEECAGAPRLAIETLAACARPGELIKGNLS